MFTDVTEQPQARLYLGDVATPDASRSMGELRPATAGDSLATV